MPKRNFTPSAELQRLWSDLPLNQPEFQNDSANAERFVRMHRGRVRYCPKLGQWFVWDNCRWQSDARTLAMQLAKETAAAMLPLASPLGLEAVKFAKGSNNRQSLENMLSLAAVHPELVIEPDDLDRDPMLLNCLNGTLDLRTLRLKPHEQSDLLTKLCPVEYVATATSPEWDRFLATVVPDNEHRQFLQRWFGYCLTGETREQLLLIFLGSGANGKSTLLDVCQAVLGVDFAIQGSPDLLVDKPRDSHPTNRMDLHGKRLAVCTEMEHDQKLAESLLKQLTGSDPVRGRRMREDNWQFRPTAKFIVCTNHMPKFSGDEAVWRRVIVVPFDQRFWNPATDAPGPESHRQDKHLPGRLKADAAAVLAWMVAGCRQWQADGGLCVPSSLRLLTDRYRYKNDVVWRFVDECCETGCDFTVTAACLRGALESFCQTMGGRVPTPQEMAERLKALGFTSKKSSTIHYCGLRLKPNGNCGVTVKPPPPRLPPPRRPK